jgi:hypothetical protein
VDDAFGRMANGTQNSQICDRRRAALNSKTKDFEIGSGQDQLNRRLVGNPLQ